MEKETASRLGMPLKPSKYSIRMADGRLVAPAGDLAVPAKVVVQGVEAELAMPVLEAEGQYQVLLGQDWLYAVDAIGHYRKRHYVLRGSSDTPVKLEPIGEDEVVNVESASVVGDDDEELDSLIAAEYRKVQGRQVQFAGRAEVCLSDSTGALDACLESLGYSDFCEWELPGSIDCEEVTVLSTKSLEGVSEEACFEGRFGSVKVGELTAAQREQVYALLNEYEDRFVDKNHLLFVEPTPLMEATVHHKRDKEPYFEMHRFKADPDEIKAWKEIVSALMKKGFIRHWTDADQQRADETGEHWRSRARLIPKPKNREFRMAVNLIQLNKWTERIPSSPTCHAAGNTPVSIIELYNSSKKSWVTGHHLYTP